MWRRVKLVERDPNGDVTAERRFSWEDLGIVEERDATDSVVKRFWGVGEERPGATPLKLTYTRDHLGSIREVVDASGAVRVRYAYDEWGKRTKLEGDLDCDFGFTGHFEHVASGITLAPYRGYEAKLGRWLNRDPLGEEGGLNLYGYVLNMPVTHIDPLGLDDVNWVDPRLDDGRRRKMVDRAPRDPNFNTAGGEGGPNGGRDKNSNPLTPEQAAKDIRNNPNYNPNKPVKLKVCSAGADGLWGTNWAQQVANALQNPHGVWAPTKDFRRTNFFGKYEERIEPGGKWKPFYPQKPTK